MNNFLENVDFIENPFPLSVTYKPMLISVGKILLKVKLTIPLDNVDGKWDSIGGRGGKWDSMDRLPGKWNRIQAMDEKWDSKDGMMGGR